MLRTLMAVLVCAAFSVSVPLASAHAQTTDKTEDTGSKATKKKSRSAKSKDAGDSETKDKKKLTPQQEKMKECGAKWQEEKKAKNVKGREAYRKFLSTCLKK